MRLQSARIEGYRCISDLTIAFDDLTVLIGANGTGKSSVLRALLWFFEGGALELDDLYGMDPEGRVSVQVTFDELTDADRAALGKYGTSSTATFWRTWSLADGNKDKLTGRGLAYPPFEDVRAHSGAAALKEAYRTLIEDGHDLPSYRNADQARQALDEREGTHPDQLQPATSSATHLFGFVGGPRLAGRFDYVLVPAAFDVEEQTRDVRGTLLARLIERSAADPARIEDRLRTLGARFESDVQSILVEEHQDSLRTLGEQVTAALRSYVRDATVTLEVSPPEVRVPPPRFDMRLSDAGVETDVVRQGHGLQRALVIATLQELSRTEQVDDAPALFLAVEEPELYQHPTQARHFATVLAALPRRGEGAIGVSYATHNEYFIDPANFHRLRRFRKKARENAAPEAQISTATVDGIATRLAGILERNEVEARIGVTLRRMLSEAVFADAVLLVEGGSDCGTLTGVADRDGGLDAYGIAVVGSVGKTLLPLLWAILTELEVPIYTVFDGDRGVGDRIRERYPQKSMDQLAAEIENAEAEAKRYNRSLLRLNGAPEEDWPDTTVATTYAVFADDLEREMERSWPGFLEEANRVAAEAGARRGKSDEWYHLAARGVASEPPPILLDVIAAVRKLAR